MGHRAEGAAQVEGGGNVGRALELQEEQLSVRLIQTVLSLLPRVSLVYSEYLRALGLISLKELSQSPVIRGVLQADRCPWGRIPVS